MYSRFRILTCTTAVLFILSYAFPGAMAERLSEGAYPYPYKNPWIATSTVSLMQGRETLPGGDIRDLQVKIFERRGHPYLEGKGKLLYRFYQQKGPAPLIFIVPGIGSSAYTGSALYLAEFLGGHGFHVLVLPSPFHWNFALAASRSGVPGLVREDAEDLYLAMEMTLNEVKRQWGAKIGKIGLMGLSEGALNAGHIGRLEGARNNKLGFSAYLLINPPVDMLESIRKIDEMANLGEIYGENQRRYLQSYAVGKLSEALNNDPASPDYFAGWDKRIGLSNRQIGYLIGNELQNSVGDAIYAIDLGLNLNILNSSFSYRHRSQRLAEARSYTLQEYVEKFIIPQHRRMDLKELNTRNSLKFIKTTLKSNKNIYLMHNLDDFLLSDQDIAFLETTFGDRAILYPNGGHLGNLWYSQNKKDILRIFAHLLK
jgi:hypothetical protein